MTAGAVRRQSGADFWSRVALSADPGACWLCTGGRSGSGYGVARWQGQQDYAHRIAYKSTYGPIPEGLVVRHTCDNPLCCRPEHLILGRHADNMADMAARGRVRSRAISAAQAHTIRTSDRPATVLAAELGVTPTAVHKVRRGETHK